MCIVVYVYCCTSTSMGLLLIQISIAVWFCTRVCGSTRRVQNASKAVASACLGRLYRYKYLCIELLCGKMQGPFKCPVQGTPTKVSAPFVPHRNHFGSGRATSCPSVSCRTQRRWCSSPAAAWTRSDAACAKKMRQRYPRRRKLPLRM